MFMKFLIARRVRHKLARLDDRLLKDIGISRSEIDRIAGGNFPERHSGRIRAS